MLSNPPSSKGAPLLYSHEEQTFVESQKARFTGSVAFSEPEDPSGGAQVRSESWKLERAMAHLAHVRFFQPPPQPRIQARSELSDKESSILESMAQRPGVSAPPVAQGTWTLPHIQNEKDNNAYDRQRQRSAQLDQIERPPTLQPLIYLSDTVKDEILSVNEASDSITTLLKTLRAFYKTRLDILDRKRLAHLVRWARFGTSAPEVERLWPTFTARLKSIADESEDCKSRMQRLSWEPVGAERQQLDVVRPDDLRIYMRWLITLQQTSVRVNPFIQKVQWLPFSARFELWERASTLQGMQSSAERQCALPRMIDSIERLDGRLQELKRVFDIHASLDASDVEEFFFFVKQKFSAVFATQVATGHHPEYGCSANVSGLPTLGPTGQITESESEYSSRRGTSGDANTGAAQQAVAHPGRIPITSETTYLKPSTWLLHSKLSPHISGEQELQSARLGLEKTIDVGLLTESGFLANDNVRYVETRLQELVAEHNIRAVNSAPIRASVDSPQIDTPQDKNLVFAIRQHVAHKLLSLYFLRHLRARDLRQKLLGILNYFRSVERRIAIDMAGVAADAKDDSPVVGQSVPSTWGGRVAPSTAPLAGSVGVEWTWPEPEQLNEIHSVQCRDDAYVLTKHDMLRVYDNHGIPVLYDVALKDFEDLETELLRLGTLFLRQRSPPSATTYPDGTVRSLVIDRGEVIADLLDCEVWFQSAKRRVFDLFLEAYEHTFDPQERTRLAQHMVDLMALRPRIDLNLPFFINSYASEVVRLELQASFLADVHSALFDAERRHVRQIYSKPTSGVELFGSPDAHAHILPVVLRQDGQAVGVMEFYPSLGSVARMMDAVELALRELVRVHRPSNTTALVALHRSVLEKVSSEWQLTARLDQTPASDPSESGAACLHGIAITNASSMQSIVEQLCEEQHAQTEQEFGGDPPSLDGVETTHASRLCSLYASAIEVLSVRNTLINVLFETELLQSLYTRQARLMGNDPKVLVEGSLSFDTSATTARNTGGGWDLDDDMWRRSEGRLADAGPPVQAPSPLAVSEFDRAFATFNFPTWEGVKEVITKGVERLRRACHAQLVEKNVLMTAVKLNQISLDHYVAESAVEAPAPPPAHPTSESAGVLRKHHAYERDRYERLLAISNLFVSVRDAKTKTYDSLLTEHRERSQALLGSSRSMGSGRPVSGDGLLKLRIKGVANFCSDMTAVIYEMALRSQLADVCADMNVLVGELAHPEETPYMLGQDPTSQAKDATVKRERGALVARQLGAPSVVAAKAKALAQGKPTDDDIPFDPELVSADGQLINVWFVPHPVEVLGLYSDEPSVARVRNLKMSLQIVLLQRDILFLLRGQSALAVGPLDVLAAGAGTDVVPLELARLSQEIRSLSVADRSNTTVTHLQNRRAALHMRLVLTLLKVSETFAARDNKRAAQMTLKTLDALVTESGPLALWDTGRSPHYAAALVEEQQPDVDTTVDSLLKYDNSRDILLRYGRLVRATPFVGWHVRSPLDSLRHLLVHLNDAERNYANGEAMAIDMNISDLLGDRGMHSTTQPTEALALQSDYYHAALSVEQLKRVYISRCIDVPGDSRLVFGEPLKASESIYIDLVNQMKTRALAVVHDEQIQRRQTEEDQLGSAIEEPLVLKETVTLDAISFRCAVAAHLRQSLEKLMIKNEIDAVNAELALLTGHSAQDSARPAREQMLDEFVRSLIGSSVVMRDSADGLVYSIPATAIHKSLHDLGLGIAELDVQSRKETAESLSSIRSHLLQRLNISERNCAQLHQLRHSEAESVVRRVQEQVSDQSYDLLIEIAGLHRRLGHIREEMASKEANVRAAVKAEYDEVVREMTTQLLRYRARLSEHRSKVYQDVLDHLNEVKTESMQKLADSASAHLELKAKSLKIIARENEVNKVKAENARLSRVVLMMKTMNQMKGLASKAISDKQLNKARQQVSETNKAFYALREETDAREHILRGQLAATQKQLGNIQTEADQLKKDLDMQQKNKRALVRWKVEKSQVLAELQEKLEKYELWSTVDVDRLIKDLERKEKKLDELQSTERRASRSADLTTASKSKELNKTKKELEHQKKLKLAAFSKVEELRGNLSLAVEELNETHRSQSSPGRKRPSTATPLGSSVSVRTAAVQQAERLQHDLDRARKMSDALRRLLVEKGVPDEEIDSAVTMSAGGRPGASRGVVSWTDDVEKRPQTSPARPRTSVSALPGSRSGRRPMSSGGL